MTLRHVVRLGVLLLVAVSVSDLEFGISPRTQLVLPLRDVVIIVITVNDNGAILVLVVGSVAAVV